MSRIRGKNTAPELIVRSILHRMGFRFRLHSKHLPGRPDIVLSKHSTVVFVHGCFWHQHKGCRKCTLPASNKSFWRRKLERNVVRDKLQCQNLVRLGWRVMVIWECQTKDPHHIEEIAKRLASSHLFAKPKGWRGFQTGGHTSKRQKPRRLVAGEEVRYKNIPTIVRNKWLRLPMITCSSTSRI